MKIIFFGTSAFAVGSLKAIAQAFDALAPGGTLTVAGGPPLSGGGPRLFGLLPHPRGVPRKYWTLARGVGHL